MAYELAAAGISSLADLIGSGVQAYYEDKAREQERKDRERALRQLEQQGVITQQQYGDMLKDVEAYYKSRPTLGQASDIDAYRKAISSYNPQDYAYTPEEFSFDKTQEDYLNPYYAQIIGQTRDQLQHTAAGAGLGRGTGAALNIAQGVASKSDELYNTAMNQYQNERDFAYKKYADAIAANQNRLNQLRQATENKIAYQGNLAQDYTNTKDQYMSDILGIRQDAMGARQAYDTAALGLY